MCQRCMHHGVLPTYLLQDVSTCRIFILFLTVLSRIYKFKGKKFKQYWEAVTKWSSAMLSGWHERYRSLINENGGNIAVKIGGSNHLIAYYMWTNHFLQKFIYKNKDGRDDSANNDYINRPKTKNQIQYFYYKAIGAFYLKYLTRVWFKILKLKRLTFLH